MNITEWSVRHPIGTIMLIMSLMLLGLFSWQRLQTTLLPDIIYPDIRVRVLKDGVDARIMEDQITRQLEEQLAITIGVTRIRSHTSEGRSAVDLSFPYGIDINKSLQDASARLDRAKRFLPVDIEPPIIYKRDPAQIPVAEMILSANNQSPVQLRQWADQVFSKYFVTLDGIAAIEVGGGLQRQIHILIRQDRLQQYQIQLSQVLDVLRAASQDYAAGRMLTPDMEIAVHTRNQFRSLTDLQQLIIKLMPQQNPVRLEDIATIIDSHEDERLKVRMDGTPGVKLSIQKQPDANTIEVVQKVRRKLQWLRQQHLLPAGVSVKILNDQSVFVRYALNNAIQAATYGALLAMLMVWLFLRDVTKMLIIGSTIPIAIIGTLLLMQMGNLSLNLMSLGGLAIGIGMLVDNTIVMLEQIDRHQQHPGHSALPKRIIAASEEIYSALLAATATNLAAVLPFLFIGGISGLFFHDLIITISAALIASLLIAISWVPALVSLRKPVDTRPAQTKKMSKGLFLCLQNGYAHWLGLSLRHSLLIFFLFGMVFIVALWLLPQQKHIFMPKIDEGRVTLGIKGESGMRLQQMEVISNQVEQLLAQDKAVKTRVATIGGFIFGRSQYQRSNRSTFKIQLYQQGESPHYMPSNQWVKQFRRKLARLSLPGIKFWLRIDSIRGIRFSQAEEDVDIRIKGADLAQLSRLGEKLIARIKARPFLQKQLKNLHHSYDDFNRQITIEINKDKAARYHLDAQTINQTVRAYLDGISSATLLQNDVATPIIIRLRQQGPSEGINDITALKNSIITYIDDKPVYLAQVARIRLQTAPMQIERDGQQRINQISADLLDQNQAQAVYQELHQVIDGFAIPSGYQITLANAQEINTDQQYWALLGLAVFLVFAVMAVQYESLRNPLIILLAVPFSLVSIVFVLAFTKMPFSMPVWLGIIMLSGIVVNNAIVLLTQIERECQQHKDLQKAIVSAGKLRLKAILMTTLTTVCGLLPLALSDTPGNAMLKPLAIIISAGISFSVLVSLILIPNIYYVSGGRRRKTNDRIILNPP